MRYLNDQNELSPQYFSSLWLKGDIIIAWYLENATVIGQLDPNSLD